MSRLSRHPVGRFVAGTALLGSLADWVLFATLVALVDARTGGSAWATAAVLLARLVPATVFAPLAARRVDDRPLRSTLLWHEGGRVTAVVAIALVAPWSLPLAVFGLVALEYAAAILAAGRESLISRNVPNRLHPAVNTATAVASYGLLPVGALVVQALGVGVGVFVAVGGYSAVLLAYALAWPAVGRPVVPIAGEVATVVNLHEDGPADAPVDQRRILRTVAAAAVGLAPIVAIFTVAPRLAEHWLGDPTATALPFGLLLAGGAGGFVLANRRAPEWSGLLAAAGGLLVASVGWWQVGLFALGIGAGLSYLGLQTRLQGEAQDPSQFARAFAVLKVATIAGTIAGPVAWSTGGPTLLLAGGAVACGGAALFLVDPRPAVRRLVALVVRRVVVIEQVGDRDPSAGVVVSNHPNAVDGVVALAADLTLRPVARWQANPVARVGIWLADSVVTTAGTTRAPAPAFEVAAQHLRGGGRIWLAPEGGAHGDDCLRAPRSGAVRMAAAARVPIQVLGIVHHTGRRGPRLADWRPWRRPRVTLVWGRTIAPTGDVVVDNDRMMAAIATACGGRWEPSAHRGATTAPSGRTVAA